MKPMIYIKDTVLARQPFPHVNISPPKDTSLFTLAFLPFIISMQHWRDAGMKPAQLPGHMQGNHVHNAHSDSFYLKRDM